MKKSLSLLVLTSSLVLSSYSFGFISRGSAMKCTKGPLNMGIYDKDVSCPNTDADRPNMEYCIMDLRFNGDDTHGLTCQDDGDFFIDDTGESYSFRKKPHFMEIIHDVHPGPKARTGHGGVLHFTYNRGRLSNNCAQVFGSDANCRVIKSGDRKHPTYQLVISRNP